MIQERFRQTATTYRQGSLALPREYYVSEDVFAEETERLFATQWNCVGRAFFNLCRHRGTRLCEDPAGRFEYLRLMER